MRYFIAAAVLAPAVLVGCPAAAAPPSCASLGATIEASQMCHLHASGATYMLDMTFPVDYPDQQALTDYITQNRDGFVNVAQGSGRRDQPYQMEATTEQHSAGQPPHNTRSVVLKFFQDLGGAHPSTWYKAFNYNLGSKQPITFDNLFAPGAAPLDTIFPIVQRELGRQTGLALAISPGAGRDPSNYQNFAITDDQLIFYFAQGELLPSFVGPTQAQVPRSAIPPLAI
ncbi:Immunogenic protein MPB64 [Mycobacterium simulans]|uniref:esterase n=1 Tax=Mycobacterium simulans TaxID=627089 RepID=UPI00174A675E|nr:esterase [Mycobacterium simulans]SON62649.1 Immunogenic protein MPB64 [Mycobacterium simulans]